MSMLQPKYLSEAALFAPTADAWAISRGLMVAGGGLGYMVGSHNLSELTDVPQARVNLGLVIGTDVQAYSPNLTRYAGVYPSNFSLNLLNKTTAGDWVTTLFPAPLPVSLGGTGQTTLAGLMAAVSLSGIVRAPAGSTTDLYLPSPSSNALLAWDNAATAIVAVQPNYVSRTGDAMSGPLVLPGDGLRVGTSQLALVGGNVGIGTTSPTDRLQVVGNISASGTITAFNLTGTNTGDQTIVLTGDVTGSGKGSFVTALANSGVNSGTYRSVTVDSKGRVIGGSNPTTLAGYGITDAQPGDADLTAIAVLSETSGLLRKTAANTWTLDTANYLTTNQLITFSGDVIGSGTTAVTLSIGTNAVTLSQMAQMATSRFLGRISASTGNVETLTGTQATSLLDVATTTTNGLLSSADKTKLDALVVGGSTITLTGDVTGSGTGTFATTLAANSVTLAKMAQITTATFLGRTSAATGNVEALSATQATALLNTATQSLNGLLSAGDKTKLDGIETGATANLPPIPGTITGTTYTLSAADINSCYTGYKRTTSASAVVITIPTNATWPAPVRTVVSIEQAGSGGVTMAAASGVTLNSRGGLVAIAGQFGVIQIKKVDTDTWTLIGDAA